MKSLKRFLGLLTLLLASTAFADAVIFSSEGLAQFLSTTGWKLKTGERYVQLTVNPTSGGGVAAQIGSMGVRNNSGAGELWLKTGAADTAWLQISGFETSKWGTLGNAGTNASTNFVGTTDAVDLVLRSNSTEHLRMGTGLSSFTGDVRINDSLQLEDPGAGSNEVTLSAPTLSGDYSLTLPTALPGSTLPLLSTSAGVMSFAQINLGTMVTGNFGNVLGGSFGSSSANSASSGTFRLANTECVSWRNAANSANETLCLNASDQLESSAPVLLPGSPTAANEAATKAYVDAAAQGAKVKPNIRVATVVAGTLATSFENGDTVDGVVLATNDRILVKNQVAQDDNGIYVVQASGAPVRATDSDTWDELVAAYAFIQEGTANQYSGWRSTTVAGGVLETDPIVFAQFSQVGTITTDGEGIEITGSELALELNGGTLVKSASGLSVATTALTEFVGDSGAGGTKGIVPAPGVGDAAAGKYLSADGTWSAPGDFTGVRVVDRFSGDGVDTTFDLSQDPGTEDNTEVYISGVYQQKNTYSMSGVTLTFSTAPPSGTDNIEVNFVQTVSIGNMAAGSIDTAEIADGAVTTPKIADLNVTTAKLAADAVTSGKILDGTIVAADLATDAVSTIKIQDDAVTEAKIADGAVTADKIADGAIGAAQMAALNYGESSGSGLYSTGSGSYTDVTNLSVTITTTGRPVIMQLFSAATGDVLAGRVAATTSFFTRFVEDGTSIAQIYWPGTTTSVPCSGFAYFRAPSAGSHTYKFQVKDAAAGTISVDNCKLVVREL